MDNSNMVDHILDVNLVNHTVNYLELSRRLSQVYRCNALVMNRKPTVAEHTLNCLFLIDFLNSQGFIEPVISRNEVSSIKNWLQYHDLEESLLNDIPYHVARMPAIAELSEEMRLKLSSKFVSTSLSEDLMHVCKIVDMLDFWLTMRSKDAYLNASTVKCLDNANEVLERLSMSGFYKVYVGKFKKEYIDNNMDGRVILD